MAILVEEGLHPNGMDLVMEASPRRIEVKRFEFDLELDGVPARLYVRAALDGGKLRAVRSLHLYAMEPRLIDGQLEPVRVQDIVDGVFEVLDG